MSKIEIEIPEGKKAEWVNGVLTLVDEKPKVEFKFKVGDNAVLKQDTAFKQGNGVCLISAGAEVEIVSVFDYIDDTDKLYEVKYQNGTSVIQGCNLILVEPKPIEFKFKVGDEVNYQEECYEVIKQCYFNEPWYIIQHDTKYRQVKETELEPYSPKDITERIKTFEDACEWCRDNGKEYIVEPWDTIDFYGDDKDVDAYLKLRIITCALNEGWEPKFEKGEWRWYAWYDFLTNEELDEMSEEEIKEKGICRVVGRASHNANAYGGLVYSGAFSVSLYSYAGVGSRLAFKSEELAEYAAKQFRDIYADFCGCKKGGEE